MALHIGFDPGGTGRKIAHLTAAIDDDERLFVGHLRDGAFANPVMQFLSFPYLNAATLGAIDRQLRAALSDLLTITGPVLPACEDPLAEALKRFGVMVISVDAPSGFAVQGNAIRHTETAVAGNFNTPAESTFLSSAAAWLRAGNMTPLRQRVFWKLVGFAIYRHFTGASTAAQVAAAASHGVAMGLSVVSCSGLRVFESFPSETYRATVTSPALALARQFATRKLVSLPSVPLHPMTLAACGQRLQQIGNGVPGAWARTRGRRVGDCLDAFASMMLGPWAMGHGVRFCGTSVALMPLEGAIVLPQ